jgi:hypothetical protein
MRDSRFLAPINREIDRPIIRQMVPHILRGEQRGKPMDVRLAQRQIPQRIIPIRRRISSPRAHRADNYGSEKDDEFHPQIMNRFPHQRQRKFQYRAPPNLYIPQKLALPSSNWNDLPFAEHWTLENSKTALP